MTQTTIALETKMNFLFEKQNEPYMWYGEVSIVKEKFILAQESFWSRVATANLAEKGGAWL